MQAPSEKSYWPPAYIYFQAVVIALAMWYLSAGFYIDDAYISLRYAKNLLNGDGMTWNPGERVEGYTNFLFILLTAGFGWLGGMDLERTSRVLGVSGYFGTVAAIAIYLRSVRPTAPCYGDKVCEALAISMVVSSAPLLVWCFGGLEGNLFACFLTAGVCLALRLLAGHGTGRSACLLGLGFALATLTRPDGAIFSFFTLGLIGGLWLLPATRRRIRFSHAAMAATAFLVIFLPYTWWRLSYFGEWLPNTYYAKIYGIDRNLLWLKGIGYVLQYFFTPPLLAFFAAAMALIVIFQRRLTLPLAYLIMLAGLMLAYVIRVGGDSLGYFRFMIPMVPVLALIVYHSGLLIIRQREIYFRNMAGALVILSIFQVGMAPNPTPMTPADKELLIGNYINAHWPKGSLVALNGAGALPYFAGSYRYIDMLGLLDKHIGRRLLTPSDMGHRGQSMVGHMKGDGAYVFSRLPDYIIPGYSSLGHDKPFYLGDAELFAMPGFKKHYRRVEVYLDLPQEVLRRAKEMRDENPKNNMAALLKIPAVNVRDQFRFLYYERIK